MAGQWPSLVFSAFLSTETKSRSIRTNKNKKEKRKERGQYPTILTDQAWSEKCTLCCKKNCFNMNQD